MGNMSNQQLMQMQLHGMDLQRMGVGMPGGFWLKTCLQKHLWCCKLSGGCTALGSKLECLAAVLADVVDLGEGCDCLAQYM